VREPLISIVTPVYDTDADVLAACIDSVRRQIYPKWQLCLVDDASPSAHVWPQLEEAVASDPRIVARHRQQNGGIVAASNDALAMAEGEVVTLLDHDDELHPDALQSIAKVFDEYDDVDYAYTDEDVIDPTGRRHSPFYKPDWSPERFRAQMYCCHLSAIRASLLHEVGGFRDGFDGAQDWDLVLRVTERARRIVHVPDVLYHWRNVPTSVLAGTDVKPYAYESALKALSEHCERIGIDGEVTELDRRGHFRVQRRVKGEPLVSIVIPTRGSGGTVWGRHRTMVIDAVRSVVNRSTYEMVEFVVVADAGTPESVLDELERVAGERLRVIRYDRPFNFSEKCNVGAAHARGELLLFLNDDVEVISPDWLETLIGFAQDPGVGAVGCELLFEDGRLQHAGHVYLGGNPAHLMFGRLPGAEANRLALALDREVAGVTAAAMLVRAEVFDEVGGFCTTLPNNYNDVDLSMKIRTAGYRIVVTPNAKLYHFESVSRDAAVSESEMATLRSRWWRELNDDPYYSRNHAPGLDGYPEPLSYP
jgi:GT2 family glycosyltransferase